MVSTSFIVSYVILMAGVAPVSATAASTEVFPSLRKKRMEKEKQMQAKAQAEIAEPQVTQPKQDDAPVAVTPAKQDDAPVVVPPPVDVGTDGFPELPAVSTMLSAASGTLKSVNSKASSLEARVVQAQMQSEAKMARQKAAFEEKLKGQEEGSRLVIATNDNISAEISQLQADNDDLRKHAHEVEETNRVMRTELHTLESRLGVAKDFAVHSLKVTDDSKSALLEVLKVSGNRHRHSALVETSSNEREVDDTDDDDGTESDVSDDDSDDSDGEEEETSNSKEDAIASLKNAKFEDSEEAASFLSVSMQAHRKKADRSSNYEAAISEMESAVPPPMAPVPDVSASQSSDPNDLLEVLSKEVAALAQQEKESEKTLKSLFIRDFRAGAKRHQALLAQQKNLLAKRGSLLAVQEKLKDAVAHLEVTKTELESRLKGLGQFLQKLSHFAMAPQREVSHLLEVLPKAVSFGQKKKTL